MGDIREAVRALEEMVQNLDSTESIPGRNQIANSDARLSDRISVRDAARWAALTKFDKEVASAVAEVEGIGPEYVERLRRDFLAVSDKAYLPVIITHYRVEAEQRRLDPEAAVRAAAAERAAFSAEHEAMDDKKAEENFREEQAAEQAVESRTMEILHNSTVYAWFDGFYVIDLRQSS